VDAWAARPARWRLRMFRLLNPAFAKPMARQAANGRKDNREWTRIDTNRKRE
jgi:hypothetical protein